MYHQHNSVHSGTAGVGDAWGCFEKCYPEIERSTILNLTGFSKYSHSINLALEAILPSLMWLTTLTSHDNLQALCYHISTFDSFLQSGFFQISSLSWSYYFKP